MKPTSLVKNADRLWSINEQVQGSKDSVSAMIISFNGSALQYDDEKHKHDVELDNDIRIKTESE